MRLLLAASLLLCACVAAAQTQLGTGAISGTVQDSSGALVGGAQITIEEPSTGLVRQVKSNAAGEFLAPVLPTGTYRVRVGLFNPRTGWHRGGCRLRR